MQKSNSKYILFLISIKLKIILDKIPTLLAIIILSLLITNCAGDNPLNITIPQKYLIKIKESTTATNEYFAIGTEGNFLKFQSQNLSPNNIKKFDLKTNITLLDFTVLNQNNIFVVGESGSLFSSNDAGNTWKKTQIQTNNKLNTVFFLDNKGWVAGAGGKIFHSTDNGVNWIDTSLVLPHYITFIAFESNGNGFLVGAEDNTNQNAVIYTTSDFGNQWTEFQLNNITNGEDITGITKVIKIGDDYYLISENCVIKSSKLLTPNLAEEDLSLIFLTSEDNNFIICSIVEFQSKLYILGHKGHNKGVIYNLTDDIISEINQHILDGILDQTQNKMYLVGGFGYFILENNGNSTIKFDIK